MDLNPPAAFYSYLGRPDLPAMQLPFQHDLDLATAIVMQKNEIHFLQRSFTGNRDDELFAADALHPEAPLTDEIMPKMAHVKVKMSIDHLKILVQAATEAGYDLNPLSITGKHSVRFHTSLMKKAKAQTVASHSKVQFEVT